MKRKVMLLIGSTRENRKSPRAAKLVYNHLKHRESLEVTVVDLEELNIPFMTERLKFLSDPHPDIVKLADIITQSDPLIIVSPEYNGSVPGVLKNALDHYIDEYEGKTVGIVSVSKGPRGGDYCYSTLKELFRRLDAKRMVHLKVNEIEETVSESGEDLGGYGERIEQFIDEILLEA